MTTPVIMPQQGNTVESCLILEWKRGVGEKVSEGDTLCIVETDKASFEVEAPAEGILLARFFREGEDVPVLTNIAVIGGEGEGYDHFRPKTEVDDGAAESDVAVSGTAKSDAAGRGTPADGNAASSGTPEAVTQETSQQAAKRSVSPRARRLAEKQGIPLEGLTGTGPGGRIIERDVHRAMETRRPAAPPDIKSPGKREVKIGEAAVTEIPVKGIRKLIADRMLASLRSTAQLTLNRSADADTLLAYRKRLKTSGDDYGLSDITINDFLLFATARTLASFKELNALFREETIYQYEAVHLAFAVDTPRGLMVPVIRSAHLLSLKELAEEAKQLSSACIEGGVNPDELSGGTFTVTNMGQLGIESFTPILNPPQVGILGVGGITLKPIQGEEEVVFRPHISLSLTINHQVVDGAPAARFLKTLSRGLENFELLLAE
jgi:pyruvate dehydrogenase E2 component (dihydrolipoamide acetyltransferase)